MPDIVQADLVKETTATQGVGAYSLAGAVAPFRTFVNAIATGKSCWYIASDANNFEVGLGTVTAGAPDTLSRDQVIASSNGGAAVNWGVGNKDVRLCLPADLVGSLIQDARSITAGADLTARDNGVLLLADASGGAFTQNLPAGTTIFKGYTIAMMKNDASANAITLDGNGAETINGSLTLGLSSKNDFAAVAWNGAEWTVLTHAASKKLPVPENLTLVASIAGNALTIAIKGYDGNDPSATNVVIIPFRSANANSGDVDALKLTVAASITLSYGSNLGTFAYVPNRFWVVAFNDAGAIRLGVINCTITAAGAGSGRIITSIAALSEFGIASSTAEGGAGAADSAQVFYTGTAVVSKAYTVLGYVEYNAGLATAGVYGSAPTHIQTLLLDKRLPGDAVQPIQKLQTGIVATGTTLVPLDNTIPQNTEGDQYMSQSIVPVSAANMLKITTKGSFSSSVPGNRLAMSLFQDSVANALATAAQVISGAGNIITFSLIYNMLAATTGATTFKVRAGAQAAGTTTFNGEAAAQLYGGTLDSSIEIQEIMA